MNWISTQMKPLSQIALMVVGLGVIVAGFVLMFTHQSQQVMFQKDLLAVLKTDYHWLSIGDSYTGIAAVAVGAVMMAIGAIVARSSGPPAGPTNPAPATPTTATSSQSAKAPP